MELFSLAITLFFVLDPFGNLPVAIGLLSGFDVKKRYRIIIRELIVALTFLIVFYFVGPQFLNIFHVGQADLKIGGGVVLGLISLRMVFPEDFPSSFNEKGSEPYIVPLAFPLITGPSALATVMIMAAQSLDNRFTALLMIVLAWLASGLIVLIGVALGGYIPDRLLEALKRLSGLLLAVIAVRMLMSGIHDYFINI